MKNFGSRRNYLIVLTGIFPPHLLAIGLNPRRPPSLVSPFDMLLLGFLSAPLRRSRYLGLPGCRPETLRPHLSVEFAFFGGVAFSDMFIGIIICNFKNYWRKGKISSAQARISSLGGLFTADY